MENPRITFAGTFLILFIVLFSPLFTPVTQAASSKSKSPAPRSDTLNHADGDQVRSEVPQQRGRWGLGFASITNFGGSDSAISAWLDLNATDSAQGLLAISATDPFSFGVGGRFRRTFSGNSINGFHAGGTLTLGRIGDPDGIDHLFFINFGPIFGAHFSIPNLEQIRFSVDGGPLFNLTDGHFQFSTRAFSGMLGLSIHYMF